MDIHFGVVAARCPWPSLLDALQDYVGEFIDQGPIDNIAGHCPGPTDDGFPLVAGEIDGASFILDRCMVLAASDFDRFLEISNRLDCTLGTCLGEATSGSFSLFMADRGQLKRLYWYRSELTEPLTIGEPWATESASPLDQIDGKGLFDALRSAGLDFTGWYEHGPKHAYLYTCNDMENLWAAEQGRISTAIEKHRRQHGITKDHRPAVAVISRHAPGGRMGCGIVPRHPRKSFMSRVMGWFSK